MNEADALEIVQAAIWATIFISGPFVASAMLVGILVAFGQALTQLQESTLTFVPKIIAVFGAALFSGTFVAGQLSVLTERLYSLIATGF